MPIPKIIECPRDAMQGFTDFIPTERKVEWLNALLKVGFDTLDFGSFVSPKVIPQMKDTEEVLEGLSLEGSRTKLLAIVANIKGGQKAVGFPQIQYLGFPLSLSETFQLRNTNKSIESAKSEMYKIHEMCLKNSKQLVVYLSMGFGNPYGDPYHTEMARGVVADLVSNGISIISFADTVGMASPKNIKDLLGLHIPNYPQVEFGVHLHSRPNKTKEKLLAAYEAGCRRFDGVINGRGGCPMAKDELVGNMPTEEIIKILEDKGHFLDLNREIEEIAKKIAGIIFR